MKSENFVKMFIDFKTYLKSQENKYQKFFDINTVNENKINSVECDINTVLFSFHLTEKLKDENNPKNEEFNESVCDNVEIFYTEIWDFFKNYLKDSCIIKEDNYKLSTHFINDELNGYITESYNTCIIVFTNWIDFITDEKN